MEKIVTSGRFLFGLAIMGFGIENLFCARLGLSVRGVPWFPSNAFWACVIGLALFAAGLGIAANLRARLTATLLGCLFLFYVVFSEVSKVAASPADISVRTVAFETLAMCGSAFTLAATLPGKGFGALDNITRSGPYLFGISSVVFGIDHFLVLAVIAGLVPAWLPGGLFWAYLTGAAFVAAGISILTKRMDWWGATLLGFMFLLWVLLLHGPRVLIAVRVHDPNVQNEWSSAFIALGMCGGSWICAANHGNPGKSARVENAAEDR